MTRAFMATFAAAMILCAGAARAETTECTEITAIPFVITAQGVYCLKQNFGSPDTDITAIDVQTNNVTIDLNGFKLGNLGAGAATSSTGVRADNRENVTIRNGIIRGFANGVSLTGTSSSGHVIEDLIVDKSTAVGLHIAGNGHVVRNNRFVDTDSTPPPVPGFTPVVASTGLAAALVHQSGYQSHAGTGVTVNGIYANGLSNSLIENNLISGTTSSGGEAHSIISVNGGNLKIFDNTILNTNGSSHTTGVAFSGTTDVTVQGNIFNTGFAADTNQAIGIFNFSGSNIFCFDNVVVNFEDLQTSGCTAESNTRPAAP